jgi:hypothetical protein
MTNAMPSTTTLTLTHASNYSVQLSPCHASLTVVATPCLSPRTDLPIAANLPASTTEAVVCRSADAVVVVVVVVVGGGGWWRRRWRNGR